MKRIIFASLLAASLAIPTYAQAKPRKLNCGWPHPDPACSVAPPVNPAVDPTPAPTPAPTTANPIQGVIEALIEAQATFVADVNSADTVATQLWPPTPTGGMAPTGQGPIDPIAHACYPTLSAWAAGLSLPTFANPTTTGGGLVTTFEDARAANIAAQNVIQQITNSGFPPSLQIACGGLITNTVTQAGTIAGEIGSFAMLLAKFIPTPVLAKHHVAYLKGV